MYCQTSIMNDVDYKLKVENLKLLIKVYEEDYIDALREDAEPRVLEGLRENIRKSKIELKELLDREEAWKRKAYPSFLYTPYILYTVKEERFFKPIGAISIAPLSVRVSIIENDILTLTPLYPGLALSF